MIYTEFAPNGSPTNCSVITTEDVGFEKLYKVADRARFARGITFYVISLIAQVFGGIIRKVLLKFYKCRLQRRSIDQTYLPSLLWNMIWWKRNLRSNIVYEKNRLTTALTFLESDEFLKQIVKKVKHK